jgi:hypothetical protein
VAFAASADFIDLDDGWPGVRDGLLAGGVEPMVVGWDDPSVAWSDFDLVVAVYTWGYVLRRDEFLEWADRTSAAVLLVNSVGHLRWNTDKTYLADVDAAGIPIVPTTWVRPGEEWEAPSSDYVIKPTVASGGFEAARYATSDQAVADQHLRRLHTDGKTVMVQPYQRSVDASGETGLVYLGHHYSHAVNKAPLLVADAGVTPALWTRQVVAPVEPRPDQLELAEMVIDSVGHRFGPTTYARVDVVDGDEKQPRILEVELVEPSLFLSTALGAAERFVGALLRLLP